MDYNMLKGEIVNLLAEQDVMVLATACNGRVTARSVSCVQQGLNIFFQTDKNFLKVKQIEENSQVALCSDNLQIEGEAVIKGHTLEKSNRQFRQLYKEKHYDSFKKYSYLEEEVVIKVEPSLITIWKYEGEECYRDYLCLEEDKMVRAYYTPWGG